MSKIVIVFSTYFNSPFGNNSYLFSDDRTIKGRFDSQQLCDYFWSRNKESIISDIANNPLQYLSDTPFQEINAEVQRMKDERNNDLAVFLKDEDKKEFLINYLNENEDVIKNYNNGNPLEFSTDDYKWINKLLMLIDYDKIKLDTNGNIEALRSYYERIPNDKDTFSELLRSKDALWLSNSLRDNGGQIPVDTYIPSGMSYSSDYPWLFCRFSYDKLDKVGEKSDISVYAVWPIREKSPDNGNGGKIWVDALTDQFLSIETDAEELYLILHDEDIEKSTFKVFSTNVVPANDGHDVLRSVALFEHTDDIGKFIGTNKKKVDAEGQEKEKNLEDIKQFVMKNVAIYVYATEIAKIVDSYSIGDEDDEPSTQEGGLKKSDKLFLENITELNNDLRNAISLTMNS